MIPIQQHNTPLQREDRLLFAAEAAIVTLLAGAALSQLLMVLFVYEAAGIFGFLAFWVLNSVKYFLFGFPGVPL